MTSKKKSVSESKVFAPANLNRKQNTKEGKVLLIKKSLLSKLSNSPTFWRRIHITYTLK